MSEKRYHVNDDNQVKKCSAKYRACKYSEDSSHFDNESDAIAEAERRLAKENKETAKPLKKKKSKQESQEQRAVAIYKDTRSTMRSSREHAEGSHFNNAVSTAAKKMNMSMEEVRQAIYKDYAETNNVTFEEAEAKFKERKMNRQENKIREEAAASIAEDLFDEYKEEVKVPENDREMNEYYEWKYGKLREAYDDAVVDDFFEFLKDEERNK